MESVLRMLPVTSVWMSRQREIGATLASDGTDTGDISALLLTSHHPVGQQSLLFQCAMTSAVEGLSVVYICQHPFTSLPRLVHGLPTAQSLSLRSVKFVYCVTVDELVSYCASIHMQSSLPDLIIIDDLHMYTHQISAMGSEQALAKILALLMDVMQYIQSKMTESCCRLVLYMNEENSSLDLTSLARRFHFTIATVTAELSPCKNVEARMTALPIISFQHNSYSLATILLELATDKEGNGISTLIVTENNKTLECTYKLKSDAIYLQEAAISHSLPET